MKLLSWILAILALAAAATASQDDFNLGYNLGRQAYDYGFPLMKLQNLYEIQTQTLPVNTWKVFRTFATPADRDIVAPNSDTLYSTAWLDLSKGPVTLHVPEEMYSKANGVDDRYWLIAIYDMFSNVQYSLGSVARTTPGDYVIKHKKFGFSSKKENEIITTHQRAFVIARIYAVGENPVDMLFVNSLQDKLTLKPMTPSSAYPVSSDTLVIPTGMAYFEHLCELLYDYPPLPEDAALLLNLAQIGIEAIKKPFISSNLNDDFIAGMTAAANNGTLAIRENVVSMYRNTFNLHSGYLILPTGTYGTNYILRAIVALIGTFAVTPDQAIYPLALYDRLGGALTATKSYKVHINANALPPVDGFWSLTCYTLDGFFFDNPINRYVINERTPLFYNSDGSIDLYLQPTAPTDPNQALNWLPTPPGKLFELIWRLYAVRSNAVQGILDGTGWQPPAVMPVA